VSDKEGKAALTRVRKVFADAVWCKIYRQFVLFISLQLLKSGTGMKGRGNKL